MYSHRCRRTTHISSSGFLFATGESLHQRYIVFFPSDMEKKLNLTHRLYFFVTRPSIATCMATDAAGQPRSVLPAFLFATEVHRFLSLRYREKAQSHTLVQFLFFLFFCTCPSVAKCIATVAAGQLRSVLPVFLCVYNR